MMQQWLRIPSPWKQHVRCDRRVVQAALEGLSAVQQSVCTRLGLQSCPALVQGCDDTWLHGALGLLTAIVALLLLSRILRCHCSEIMHHSTTSSLE